MPRTNRTIDQRGPAMPPASPPPATRRLRMRNGLLHTSALLATLALLVPTLAQVDHGGGEPAESSIAAPARASGEGTDPLVYRDVQELRAVLSLGNEELAGMGCTQTVAESVLRTLVSWRERNHEAWEHKREAERAAGRLVRESMRRVNIGPRDNALLAGLPQQVRARDEARADTLALLEQAADAVSALLSAEQRSLWRTARANKALPSRLRFVPGLSPEQAEALRTSTRLRSPEAREAQEAATLQAHQQSAVAQHLARVQQRMPEVLEAEATVLPATE